MNGPTDPKQPAAPCPQNGQARLRTNPQGQQRRRPPQRLSKESQFIGYLVLGLGVLAVTSVLIFAFSGGVDTDGPEPDAKVAAGLNTDMTGNTKAAKPTPAVKAEMLAMPRQKGIKLGDVVGGWKASIGNYVAVMQMDKGAFQVILAPLEPSQPRIYSSGTFSMVDDIVVFQPRSDWKAPAVPAGSDIQYERLTRGDYAMIVGFKNGAMVWQNIPASEKRVDAPSISPLLIDQSATYIVWKKL